MISLKESITKRLDSFNESIIKSNSAGHPAYRFSLYGEDSVVSIIVVSQKGGSVPEWDSKKVKSLFNKLPNIYKKDIRYVFNRNSDSKNQNLVKIWCIASSCKDTDEVEKLCNDLLLYPDRYKIISAESNIEGLHKYLRIVSHSFDGYCTTTFYIHTTDEYSDYKYVK